VAHIIKIKIYYEDTDAGGVVYYANYLRYLERARTEFLHDNGIEISEYHKQGYFFIVVHVDISYKHPAHLGDIIDVTTEVEEIKNASIIIRNQAYKDSHLLVDARVTIACIDKERKLKRLPESFKKLSTTYY